MNRLLSYTIKGIIFVTIAGTISHFVYEWTSENPFIGLFFPVNESVWEHMKLIFFPMLLYAFHMNRELKEEHPCISYALLSGVLIGTLLIPVFFYTYSGILGRNTFSLDIATFVASILCAFTAVYRLTLSCCKTSSSLSRLMLLGIMLVVFFFVCFLLFTYNPPSLGIFSSPGE